MLKLDSTSYNSDRKYLFGLLEQAGLTSHRAARLLKTPDALSATSFPATVTPP